MVLDAGLRWEVTGPVSWEGLLGLGHMQGPCSGTHSVVVGETEKGNMRGHWFC